MKKAIVVLIVLILIGVLTLEVITFVKMLNVNEVLPEINYLRRVN